MYRRITLGLFGLLELLLVPARPAVADPHFSDNRKYTHYVFRSDRLCDEARRRGPVICEQAALFSKTGTVRIALSETPSSGTYAVDRDTVHILLPGSGSGGPRRFSFTLTEEETVLTLDGSTSKWLLTPTVTGTLRFPPGAAIPLSAPVTIRIVDTTSTTARPTENSHAASAIRGPSTPFEVEARRYDVQADYGLEALVDVDRDGKASKGDYVSEETYAVLTHGHPAAIEVRLRRVE